LTVFKKIIGSRCIVIVVGNHKGGCGKTTTSFGIGVNASKQGKRVLFIDNDQQGTLGKQFKIDGNNKKYKDHRFSKIYESMSNITGEIPVVPYTIHFNKNTGGSISILLGDADLKDIVEKAEEYFGGEAIVTEKFRTIMNVYMQYFDYIIFDTTPIVDKIKSCKHSLSIANNVFIPFDEIDAVDEINQTRTAIKANSKHQPNIRFVCTKYTVDYIEEAREFNRRCLENKLPVPEKPVKFKHYPWTPGRDEKRCTNYRFMLKTFPNNMCKIGIPFKVDIERHTYLGSSKENRAIIDEMCKDLLLYASSSAKEFCENLCDDDVWSKKLDMLNGYVGIVRDMKIEKMDIGLNEVLGTTFDEGNYLHVEFEKEAVNERAILERRARFDR